MSDHGNWGDSADDDGSELIRTLSRLVPLPDVEVSSDSEESEESTDAVLDTVSEKSYHSDGNAEKSYHTYLRKRMLKKCLIALAICRTLRRSTSIAKMLCQIGPTRRSSLLLPLRSPRRIYLMLC